HMADNPVAVGSALPTGREALSAILHDIKRPAADANLPPASCSTPLAHAKWVKSTRSYKSLAPADPRSLIPPGTPIVAVVTLSAPIALVLMAPMLPTSDMKPTAV